MTIANKGKLTDVPLVLSGGVEHNRPRSPDDRQWGTGAPSHPWSLTDCHRSLQHGLLEAYTTCTQRCLAWREGTVEVSAGTDHG
jgi:hypothetical protein